MNERINAELTLLRQHYANVGYFAENKMHWFMVQMLKTPDQWSPREIPVIFAVTEGYPGTQPYGFFVPDTLNLNGKRPSEQVPHQPPFEGKWHFLSWQPVEWRATANIRSGSNLWAWVLTFRSRLREGI